MELPFWEKTYRDPNVSTFAPRPDRNLAEYAHLLTVPSKVLDVGCGEGRNAVYLAELGHVVDAFDLSEAGIVKARTIAEARGLSIRFEVGDIATYRIEKEYDVIVSTGVLHLPEKVDRDAFMEQMRQCTKPGGYHFIGVFTNRLPATPDNASFTKSLFDVGELPSLYADWEIIDHGEGTFQDEHPGGIHHEHAYERVIARKR